jgi:2-iminobutanoate/2-iminopropanoate deaminase
MRVTCYPEKEEKKMNAKATSLTFIGAVLMTQLGWSAAADSKEYFKGDQPQRRGYSEAVITEGGKTVWLAGQIATVDDNGKSLAGDFDGQARQLFKNLDRTMQKAGGKLGDIVQMTVFITDVRNGDRFTQIRREVFGDNFPGSALITITALAVPDGKIEIQGYAVIGDK